MLNDHWSGGMWQTKIDILKIILRHPNVSGSQQISFTIISKIVVRAFEAGMPGGRLAQQVAPLVRQTSRDSMLSFSVNMLDW